jgi:hypothetical protein
MAIPPRATLCKPLAVNIEELTSKVGTSDPRIDLSHIDTGNFTSDEYDATGKFLHQNQDLFSWNDTDIGHVTTVETPFKQRPRRIPPSMYQEERNHLKQLLDADIIRKFKSPFSSNVVLVKKEKSGI